MKKKFKVEGMSCGHCRKTVENALNAVDGITASVTLDPPAATIEFSGEEKTLEELQQIIQQAGEFKFSE